MTVEGRQGGHESPKSAYSAEHRNVSPRLTEPRLREMFPDAVSKEGKLGKSGVVLFNGSGDIVGSVPSPSWIPTPDGEEGGIQREVDAKGWLMRDLGEREKQIAAELLERAKRGESLGTVGKEREALLHSFHNMADKVSIPVPKHLQIETNQGMFEFALDPYDSTRIDHMRTCEHIAARTEAFYEKELFISEISVPMFGDPTIPALHLNNGVEREYIQFIHKWKLKPLANARDPYARQLGQYVARRYGENSDGHYYRYRDFDAMRAGEKGVPYWAVNGLHRSFGLKDVDGPEATGYVPSRLAIALADIHASDMGVIPKLLSMSTPVIYQDNPRIRIHGRNRWPKDYRAISQLFIDTAYPGELIDNYETLNARITKGMVEGHIPSPGRGTYVNKDTGVYTYHGDARVRCDTFGGIENTSRGATQSLLDEFAGDLLLDLFTISAAEAVSEGKTIQEHLGDKYGGSMTSNANRLDITHEYNLHDNERDGALPKIVSDQIGFCLAYLEDMANEYPKYKGKIIQILDRVINMTFAAETDSLDEYYHNPVGPFADVVKKAVDSGYFYLSEVEVAKTGYQNRVAMAIKENFEKRVGLPTEWDKELARMTQMAHSFTKV